MTQDNAPRPAGLAEARGGRTHRPLHFSHLNYAGRGNKNRKDDAQHQLTPVGHGSPFRDLLGLSPHGLEKEFTTGNNDADGVLLPALGAPSLPGKMPMSKRSCGSGWHAGINVANIDNLATSTGHHVVALHLGQREGAAVFADLVRPATTPHGRLKQVSAGGQGRCGTCAYLHLRGNTAGAGAAGDRRPWAEDPAAT